MKVSFLRNFQAFALIVCCTAIVLVAFTTTSAEGTIVKNTRRETGCRPKEHTTNSNNVSTTGVPEGQHTTPTGTSSDSPPTQTGGSGEEFRGQGTSCS